MNKQNTTSILELIQQLRELTDRAKEERDALLTLVSRLESENAQLRRENAELWQRGYDSCTANEAPPTRFSESEN